MRLRVEDKLVERDKIRVREEQIVVFEAGEP